MLADPAVQVVVHAGRQDIALMRRRFGTEVRNVFDTQVAAGFAGLGAQTSYDSLLAEMLGLRVAKSASFTRWDARPLSPEQLAYAREDVVHLLELAAELERRLSELGRLEWAREECEPLERSSDERDLETIFARLPRVRRAERLRAADRARAGGVARADGRHARTGPCRASSATPRWWRSPSASRPRTRELEQIRGVGAGSLRRRARGAARGGAPRRASARRDPPPRSARPPPPKPEDAPLVALAEALLRARAREAGLAYELLAARADLQAIVAAAARRAASEADVRTLRGWRRELVGEELLELLDGRVSLSVGSDGKLRVSHDNGAESGARVNLQASKRTCSARERTRTTRPGYPCRIYSMWL